MGCIAKVSKNFTPSTVFSCASPVALVNDNQIKKVRNSGFEYKFVNDNEQQELFTNPKLTSINEYKIFNGNITKAYLMINPLNGASRADLWRYYVLWKYAGVYLDVDSGCDRLLTHVITDTIDKHSKNTSSTTIPFGIIATDTTSLKLKKMLTNWGNLNG